MSIATMSSSLVSAVRANATSASVDPVRPITPARAAQRSSHEGGQRHELVDAMNQVLGVDGAQTKDQAQAVFGFAHALMHDLRSVDAGGAPAAPARAAWGQRDWHDLAQRIDALATAANAPATGPAPDTAAAAAPATPPPTSAAAQPSDGPPMPNPITPLSAAVHLMQVPSSHLLEAYAALRKAIGEQSASTGSQRGDLAAFLDQLVHQLAPDAAAPAGSVLHLTA
jgi:hypothetical protein